MFKPGSAAAKRKYGLISAKPPKEFFPPLKTYGEGVNKRPGAFAIYLEPWNADIMHFLQLRMNTGGEADRDRDLFYALWIPDLFMKRVEADSDWTLMCPKECPGLEDCFGEKFEELYLKYERDRGEKTIKARDIWKMIVKSQIETGTPYIVQKDEFNSSSSHPNRDAHKFSKLCTAIVEYSSADEVTVCNLASIARCMRSELINQDDYDILLSFQSRMRRIEEERKKKEDDKIEMRIELKDIIKAEIGKIQKRSN